MAVVTVEISLGISAPMTIDLFPLGFDLEDEPMVTIDPMTEATEGSGTHRGSFNWDDVDGIEEGIFHAKVRTGGAVLEDGYVKITNDVNIHRIQTCPINPEVVLGSAERVAIANAIFDLADGVEDTETLRMCLRNMRAVLCGTTEGFPNGPGRFYAKDGETVRVESVMDLDNNRTEVTTE